MPYIAELEKAGIPTVLIDLADQENMVKEESLSNGVPNVRYVHASRTIPGPEDVDRLIEPILDGLTRPLTEKEKESGFWNPPQNRVLFEGTLDEAEAFYEQTAWIPAPTNAPIAVYTDGFPIKIPTEERVREMLKGTSHKPEELITHQSDKPGGAKKGDPVQFQPRDWVATVEKVAINAVMAGCKPEQLPVVLAIAESGLGIGSTHLNGQLVCVSGPIAKELQMNTGCGMLGPGNPANSAIGRSYQIMSRNLGGAIPGVNRMNSIGNPMSNGGACFAENVDGLPPGWKGLNEESGYKKEESVVMVLNGWGGFMGDQFSPGGYRALQKSGHGGMARYLDVKGKPGPHNWMDFMMSQLHREREGGFTFIMVPELARHLYEYGFKTKEQVYYWLYERCRVPLKEYRNWSWPDLTTNGWMGIERSSGKPWKELPDDYMVPVTGDPFNSCIIVGGGEEECCYQVDGRRSGFSNVCSVDSWR